MNEKNNILDSIRELQDNNLLTNTQEDIANYILNNPNKVPIMSAEKLADYVNSSPSSINRFTKKKLNLNFKDFKEKLKNDISEEYYGEIPVHETHISFLSLIKKNIDDDTLTKTQKTIATYILNNIKKTTNSTVQELADELNISGSNFINFAKDLGLDGFKSLQENIKEDLNSKIPIEIITGKMPKEKMNNYFKEMNKNSLKNEELFLLKDNNNYFHSILAYNFEFYYTKNLIASKFFYLIENASNIIIYDYEDITRHVLHKNLNRYGYINYFTTSKNECLNQIDNIIQNSQIRKKRSKNILKKHVDPDLVKYFIKNIEGNDNLLIIHSTFNHNENVNKVIKKAQESGLSIILFESNITKDKIGSLNDVELRINIGDSISINNEKNHKSIINDIMFLELLNSQIRYFINQKELHEEYDIDELFNESDY